MLTRRPIEATCKPCSTAMLKHGYEGGVDTFSGQPSNAFSAEKVAPVTTPASMETLRQSCRSWGRHRPIGL
jgi:hypothetical protein